LKKINKSSHLDSAFSLVELLKLVIIIII
jgi:hypothetical protein